MRETGRRTNLAAPAAAFLMLWLCLCGAAEARAQWTSDGNGNVTTAGNVGVGTAAPARKLDVAVTTSGGHQGIGVTNTNGRQWWLDAADNVGNGSAVNGVPASGFAIIDWTAQRTRLSIDGDGNVEVGKTSPWVRLHVRGTTLSGITTGTPDDYAARSLMVTTRPLNDGIADIGFDANSTYRGALDFKGSTGDLQWWTNGGGGWTSPLTIAGGGNVGMGTSSPGARLHVESGWVLVGDRGDSWGSMLRLSPPAASVTWDVYNEKASGLLRFYDVTHARDVLTMSSAGDVSASGNLNVAGTVTGGHIQAKYQDVAEWVPSTQKLSAGTVVILDAGKVNHVVASATAYDTKVAGVVSEQPGVILGVGGEGKLKVATTGRVKVKVDASRGAIRVGDLLVTSGVGGVAMKSIPVDLGGTPIHRPGTIIGKALEPLESGVGEILVLLSLQ